jgi:glyoxylase-like metal-dependent hydrolase (beta-lactamase superfamily II)
VITGKYQIDVLHEGTMTVDGGITFSGLPRDEWQNFYQPDAHNKIKLGINQLLVRGERINLLIDTGMGSKIRPRKKQLMGIEQITDLESNLKNFSLRLEEITHVVFTHLHYDHAGGTTRIDPNSKEVFCVFPNAEFFVQSQEWKFACSPDNISRAAYFIMDFLPLAETGRLRLINGDIEVADGIFIEITGGHTAAHQMVRIEDKKYEIIFPGDICPTPHHLRPLGRESFDLYPMQTLQARQALINKILNKQALLVFSHGLKQKFYQITGTPENPEAIEFHES